MRRGPIFEKKIFQAENAGNIPEKPLFGIFSRFYHYFFWFFAQRCVLTMHKTWLSPIFEKIFFPAENAGNMPEIAVFADFLWVFSSYFVFFSHKNLINAIPTINFFNCHKNLFLKPELSKNRRNSQFSPENSISWISRAVLDIF